MRARLLILIVVLALLAGLVVAAAWVVATPAGLQWAYAQLRERAPGTLEVESLEGRLIGPLEVRDARYRSDGTEARLDYARLDWSPLALLGGTLDIDALSARGLRLALPPAEEDADEGRPDLALPFELRADNVELDDIRITRAGQAPYAIQSIELDAGVDRELARIERLRVAAQNFELSAEGTLGLRGETDGALATRWRVEPPGQPAIEGGGDISGKLARLRIDQHITAPVSADVRITANDVLGDLGWQAEVEIPEVDAQRLGLEGPGWRANLTLRANGNRERFETDGRFGARLPELPPLTGRFEIRGGLDGPIVLERLVLQPADSPMQLTAQGQWQPDGGRWQGRVAWQQLQWPLTGEPLMRSSEGSLDASGTLAQYRVALEAVAQIEDLPPLAWRAQGQGDRTQVRFEQLRVTADQAAVTGSLRVAWSPAVQWQTQLAWQDLRWPFDADPLVRSPEGTVQASGNLERYRLELDAATRAEDLPAARWNARGSGDRTHIRLEDVRLETLATELRGQARATWSPALAWEAELRGDGIDPAVEWPEWPGRLALAARASGNEQEQRLRIESVDGQLRGQAFNANAEVVRRGDSYPELALELRSGGASASASGALTDRWQLTWRVNADALGSLLPDAAGQLTGSGRITGPRARPRVIAEVSGTNLAYDTTRIERLELNASIDLSDRTRSQLALQASGGALLGRAFERVAVEAAGFLAEHTGTLEARFPDVGLQARLAGGYADGTWRGQVRQSRLAIAGETWNLAGNPALHVSPETVVLEQSCWRSGAARVCAALEHTPGVTQLSAAANQLPLALFQPLLPAPVELDGAISGEGVARLEGGHVQSAKARFELGSGAVALPAPADIVIDYQSASVDVVVDEQGLRAQAALALPDGDGGDATVTLPRFHAAGDLMRQPIEGRISFAMRDLAPLAGLLPRLEELQGRLALDLTLAGTLADPRLRGSASLAEAAAYIPASGVRVHDVRITAEATGGDRLELGGEAYSGGGQLGLSGRITFPGEPAWRAQLRIAGSEFQAVELGKTRVFVSPDLNAELVPGRVQVSGTVRVPRATFTLRRPAGPGVVQPSSDVVIVNAPEEAPAPPELWEVTAKIRVILGDQVTFTGFGLNAGITGEVLLIDTPGQATTARGELRVAQGQYEAYGQKLEIERGRLLFVGGPVTNPGIDARAVRKVEQVTAGVEVSGTLRDPKLSLFSDPAMGQADALSYLLFGRPMSGATSAQGRSLAAAARALQLAGGERLAKRIGAQFGFEEVEIETGDTQESAALVLGRRLSPRLYVNYSIGLFEPSNVLRLRYRLTPNWSLEAQSGTSAGGDLLYMLER